MKSALTLRHASTSGPLPTSTFKLLLNDVVLGFAQIRHRPSNNSALPPEAANHVYYEIGTSQRGKGYGKALMGMALDEARRLGLGRVRLTVLSDNPASKHIIESHGGAWLADFVCAKGETYHLYEVNLGELQ